jgi:hypothetical protein
VTPQECKRTALNQTQAHPNAVLQPHRQLVRNQASQGQLWPKEASCCQNDAWVRPDGVQQKHSSTARHGTARQLSATHVL